MVGESPGQRLRAHAKASWPQLAQVHVRFRGQFAYVVGELADGEQMPLMRLRYGGSAHRWGTAIYVASKRQLRRPDLVQRQHRRNLRPGLRPPRDQCRPLITSRPRAPQPSTPEGFTARTTKWPIDFASLLIANGADVKIVQARLRHGSAKTTLDTYGHLPPDKDESAMAIADSSSKLGSRVLRTPRGLPGARRDAPPGSAA
jgi:hypothetical protein